MTEYTRENLNALMEFDHVVQSLGDGVMVERNDIYAPELHDGLLESDSWELLDGYSGQHGYSGPLMHQSEFIGGRMARDILSEPGIYVALVDYSDDDPTEWAVAKMRE